MFRRKVLFKDNNQKNQLIKIFAITTCTVYQFDEEFTWFLQISKYTNSPSECKTKSSGSDCREIRNHITCCLLFNLWSFFLSWSLYNFPYFSFFVAFISNNLSFSLATSYRVASHTRMFLFLFLNNISSSCFE